MGILNRLFGRGRDLTKDEFAKMMVRRIQQSGETAAIEYDSDQFLIRRSESNVMFLQNLYEQYIRVPKQHQEEAINAFLASWHTATFEVPKDFEDAKADLLPSLRCRTYVEIQAKRLIQELGNPDTTTTIPYETVGECLAATLAYDLPHNLMMVNQGMLDDWGISFYEAMEIAKQNLYEQGIENYAKLGELVIVQTGDSYDATRMLLGDLLESMVPGHRIAMVPNREQLMVCSPNDETAVVAMAELGKEAIDHERFISGVVFLWNGNDWEHWLPPEDHPAFATLHELHVQSLGQTYAEQKAMLEKLTEADESAPFVASFSAAQNSDSGRIFSYCTWTEGVDTLLPEADKVILIRPNAPKDQQLVASGDWNKIKHCARELMTQEDLYPSRWRVTEFPSDEILQEIGSDF